MRNILSWLRFLFGWWVVGTDSWLGMVLSQLYSIDSPAEPDNPSDLTEKDHVVGIASPQLRKLYAVVSWARIRALEADAVAKAMPSDEACRKSRALNQEVETLRQIFWISLGHEFPELWDKELVGIRSGWKIVWTERDEVESPLVVFSMPPFGFGQEFDEAEAMAFTETPDRARMH